MKYKEKNPIEVVTEVKNVEKPTSLMVVLIAPYFVKSSRSASMYLETKWMTSDMATTNMIEGKVVSKMFIGLEKNPIPPSTHTMEDKMTTWGSKIPQPDRKAINKNKMTKIALKPMKRSNSLFIFFM